MGSGGRVLAEDATGVRTEQGLSFGERLRRLREAAGLTQEELAGRAGLTSNAISDLERGRRRRPYPHTVRSLADALGLSEEERAALVAAVPSRDGGRSAAVAVDPEAHLPTPPTPLLGRERDLEEVTSLMGRPEVRLLTLTGTGGVGKTRLALEAAREAAGVFPDGVVFVALAPLNDAGLVAPSVVRSLGLREAGDRPLREVLRDHLREKRLLLLLDNFEHVVEAAPEVEGTIESCPNLTVLVTSRAPLRVRGEREYQVRPLALPASTLSPRKEEVLASPSGRLFVERALASSPGFRLDASNAEAVAAVCWRLAGLPLALELAAARVRFLSPTTLLSRLDRALSAGWARDMPERQRTMRAALDWSYELLSEEEKALFRRLSVFAGGFTLEAAEAVGAAEGVDKGAVLDLLGGLVEQSLVAAEVADEDEARYGMLEPVRQYALEKLGESGEISGTRRRHAAFFTSLAGLASPELKRADQAGWFERLEREHDNLRGALSCLLEGGDAENAARLGWHLGWFWFVRGHLAEGTRWMDRALAQGDSLTTTGRARALTVVDGLAYSQGDLARHGPLADEGARLAREVGDGEVVALATYLGGHAAYVRREYARASALVEESLATYHALDDGAGAGLALTVLAQVAVAEGDAGRAERLFDEGEELLREAGSWWNLTANLDIRAIATEMSGDHARTVELLRESLVLSRRLRDTQNVAYGLEILAGALAMLGRARRAARLYGAAEALRERTGSTLVLSILRELREERLGTLREHLGETGLAAAWADGRALSRDEAIEEALAEGV